MRNQPYVMRDPTAELSPVLRERLAPGKDLSEAVIGLLSICLLYTSPSPRDRG